MKSPAGQFGGTKRGRAYVNHEQLATGLPSVLDAWGLRCDRITPVSGGTLNWNFEVQTGDERLFVRCYRSNLETDRIEGEHRLLRWLGAQTELVPVPIARTTGETLFIEGDQRWALFPWVEATSPERGSLSSIQATGLGEAHGRLHALLARHPDSAGTAMSMRWSKAGSLDLLARLITASRERGHEGWLSEGLEHQRRLLEAIAIAPPEDFVSLPCQLLHGDFHDQQVLFEGDQVRAVVDWEIWHSDPRAWEVVRSLAFSKLLDSPLLAHYLGGYRQHVELSEWELQDALTLWFQSRLVGVWAWWAYVMEGNERVKAFLPGMIAELDLVTNERWTSAIREQVVRAACG
jgi:homoserine kinase type II